MLYHWAVTKDPAETLTEAACSRLQQDILLGALQPQARLGVRMLAESYQIGPTPIREALSRLTDSGLITARGRQGFNVSALSRTDLDDIIWLRRTIEVEALRRAIRNGGVEWEAEITASLHVMCRGASDVIEGGTGSPLDLAFDATHRRFHRSLIAACGSERMLRLYEQLYNQTYRYRRLAMQASRWTRDVIAEHQILAKLTIDRSDEAATRLDRHIADVATMAFSKE